MEENIETAAHVAPDPEPGSAPPLRRAEDRAAYRPIESQARMSAIGAAYDHVEDTKATRVTFELVTRICNVYHEHLKMHGGSL